MHLTHVRTALDESWTTRRRSSGGQLRTPRTPREWHADVVEDSMHELVVPVVYRRADALPTPLTTSRTRAVSIYDPHLNAAGTLHASRYKTPMLAHPTLALYAACV